MQNPLTRNRLLSLVSGPIIWTIHFLACYLIVSFACTFKLGGANTGIAAVTAMTLGLLAYTMLANYRKWRMAHRSSAGDISAFFALNTMLLCGLFAVALVWVAFPSTVLPTCAS